MFFSDVHPREGLHGRPYALVVVAGGEELVQGHEAVLVQVHLLQQSTGTQRTIRAFKDRWDMTDNILRRKFQF